MAGAVTLVFFLLRFLPGDPVDWMLGERAALGDRQALRQALGLSRPLPAQFWAFLTNLVHGDFGASLVSGRPVTQLLLERMPATLYLGACALAVSLLLAVPLGLRAAVMRDSNFDRGVAGMSLLGMALPTFLLGPLLMLALAIRWNFFPLSGQSSWRSVVLPALTLGFSLVALNTRMVRAAMLDVLREPYLTTARAKGVAEWCIVWRHALRSALAPVVTIVGLQCGLLLSGAVVTEKIFSWPGVGSLLLQAIEQRDFVVVQACVLWFALGYVFIHLAVDLLNAWLDPRLRQALQEKA